MVARTLIAALLVGAVASAQDLAVRCGKVLTMGAADEIHAPGLVLVEDGKITYVGAPKELAADVPVIDAPDAWLAPGLVDLHTHIHTGGWGDINDMVYSVNPELRSAPTLRPDNRAMQIACAGGVTTLFGIPGSGTNMGGFGVLYKTKTTHRFEDAVAEATSRHPDHAEAIAAYHLRWPETLTHVIHGTVTILEDLDDKGAPLYAITNWNQDKFRETKARFDFLNRFRDIVVSGDEGLIKPDPAIYHVLLERNGLEASRCLFIDDSPKNVAGAEAVGMAGHLFTTPEALRERLKAEGLL